MASDRVRALLDDLKSGRPTTPVLATVKGAGAVSADNPLGLKFSIGARVLDLVTGARGAVQWSGRDASINQELFRVQFTDASIQWRTKEQLEPDPTPAA